jgi:hypothetical protein
MNTCWLSSRCPVRTVSLAALLLCAMSAVMAQAPVQVDIPTAVTEHPRTPWGDPDLQATWDFTTITPLERPPELEGQEFLSESEAAALEREINESRFEAEERSPGAFTGADDDPGIYNLGWWWEPEGRRLVSTRRTSLVTDPPDGRIPPLTPRAQSRAQMLAELRERRYHPADLPLAERCIMGFNSGPPMVPGPYNNLVQVVQSPGYVVLVNEMDAARVVPLDGRPHLSENVRRWTGDSRGRWEGNTLVVETRNFKNGTGTFGIPGLSDREMHLIERFTRVDEDTLIYQFTVNNPTVWVGPWTAEVPMRRFDGFPMEFACHEGNYALANILSGARAEEARSVAAETEGRD